ncbi:MAG: 23S rRNA (adenine(2503)-C(2))-methyltransferase RlmN [Candidatus Omnitrophica bacterium]|nr:23S rRNA (adenine(2503)-C(2))-methyltransferase RlmN [Candidatus Omnitrophota bacterium]MDD5553046.1 23S rRNA (adenine(2503)-C(2))-methyltransferase RlmN [Candidatus Omnitrophota bacterium]
MKDIKDLDPRELERVLSGWREPAFRAAQVFLWIYKKGAVDFEAMSNLPSGLRQRLKENFRVLSSKLVKRLKSSDGTEKFLFGLEDKNYIEAVIIPAKGRITGCVSTQAGCKFCCRFCASGVSGFRRNLTAREIIEEILYLRNNSSGKKLSHLVFMGTGEPLDNYDNVLKAIRFVNSPDTFNIGARKITISTSGVIPGIKKLAREGLQIELSVSLHAADEKTRSTIMPVNKIYPLKDLIAACREYIGKTNRQVTFEYILIKDMNSGLKNAQKLSKILTGMNCKVNIIPCNVIEELEVYPPEKKEILSFKDHLSRSGINVTLRRPRGADIEAACGQLRMRYEKKL